ncbi:DUF255 domain-containing protein [Hymenobacter sp. H14-R3]|uniref:DUF255 domain-containing protein n=1 Tax=Hymenobacter sp. H14-R3 TaxID=3046308 RepID=UPI0032D9876B
MPQPKSQPLGRLLPRLPLPGEPSHQAPIRRQLVIRPLPDFSSKPSPVGWVLFYPVYSAPMPASSSPANRLAHETSPYLLQHAHNPVDWYPWAGCLGAGPGRAEAHYCEHWLRGLPLVPRNGARIV